MPRILWIAIIAAIFTLFISTLANAQGLNNTDLNLDGLSDAQIAELIQQAEGMRTTPQQVDIERLNQYAEFGQAFGSAIAQTAAEVGQATNEFIQTPAGKIAVALIVWKVAGDDLLGVVAGIVWYLVMIPLWMVFWKKNVTNMRWQKVVNAGDNGKTIVTTEATAKDLQERADIATWVMLVIFGFICIAGFVMIF